MGLLGMRRILVLSLLALAVPLQAVAGGGSGGEGLSVSASLDHCGVSASGVVCKIDASWGSIDGADRYTATVTTPGGGEHNLGTVGGDAGSTSAWVPFAGNGTYTVTVTAWGADENGRDRRVRREDARIDDGRLQASGSGDRAGPEAGEEKPAEGTVPAGKEPATEQAAKANSPDEDDEEEEEEAEDEEDEEATNAAAPLSSSELAPAGE